jgi:hypothetical protein
MDGSHEYVGARDEEEAAENCWPNREQIEAMCQEFQRGWNRQGEMMRNQFAHWRQASPHCPGPLADILRDHK